MTIAFYEFLEAKYQLDERSLNCAVKDAFRAKIKNYDELTCLDVGTGTGAMLRRLISNGLQTSLKLTGLDSQAELLAIARIKIDRQLKRVGYSVTIEERQIIGKRMNQEIGVVFEHLNLQDFLGRSSMRRFDLITAQTLMDLVPLQTTLEDFAKGLAEGGLFYTTLNYDGETTLLPLYHDQAFEQRLLDAYNGSMENRRVAGIMTGGAYAGRRLHALLPTTGFRIIAEGSSDWDITPLGGGYRDQDQVCLSALLDMIQSEGARCSHIDGSALTCWYQQRRQMLEQGRLGMIVHQLDILAEKVNQHRVLLL